MFIIDFDDTLFDTQAFKQARLEAVQKLGVSDNEYWRTYRIARNSPDGLFTYSDMRHAEVLEMEGYVYEEVLGVLEYVTTKELPTFLYDDAIATLDELKAYNNTMILLSLGNPGFQEIKTKGSGIADYFDRRFMVHTTKQHILEELFGPEPTDNVWFINDKVEETMKLKKQFPFLKVVLKQSPIIPIDEYKESGLSHFNTLTHIASYVRNN